MGNNFSSKSETTESAETAETADILEAKSTYEIIDYIATYYILTADYVSLTKLYDKDYCNKLVILTSDIVERYFTDLEITYLAQRTKDGIVVNELQKDKIIFFEKEALQNLDIQNALKKKRVCQSIAKFYIKIAHVFATIVRTINPVYVYKDFDGNIERANLYEKGNIPADVPRELYKMNICDMRINALRSKQDYSTLGENDPMTINPNICSMNINDSGKIKSLKEEPGIPELEHLYYDDGYDFETGEFVNMSSESALQFAADLKIFHEYFTGNKDMDENIKKFSDIKLRDFGQSEECSENIPEIKGTLSDNLFAKYADNLKQMIASANNNQNKLTDIINQLFAYTTDPQTKKKVVRVNPDLTEEKLQQVVVDTRALVIKLYLTCEQDFEVGVNIYKAIVAQKTLDTVKGQTLTLERERDNQINYDEFSKTPATNEDEEEVVASFNEVVEDDASFNEVVEDDASFNEVVEEDEVVKDEKYIK
jgi:hypothetical protein